MASTPTLARRRSTARTVDLHVRAVLIAFAWRVRSNGHPRGGEGEEGGEKTEKGEQKYEAKVRFLIKH